MYWNFELFPRMETHKEIENCRIKVVYGSNEANGVFLRINYEVQEDGSNIGVPMEVYTGSVFLLSVLIVRGIFTISQRLCE